jgi:hypothetical protein
VVTGLGVAGVQFQDATQGRFDGWRIRALLCTNGDVSTNRDVSDTNRHKQGRF